MVALTEHMSPLPGGPSTHIVASVQQMFSIVDRRPALHGKWR